MTGRTFIETNCARLEIPEGWSSESVEGADAALVAPSRRGDFRANVVLTSTASTATASEALDAAIEAAWAQHPGSRVLATDVWPGEPEGRRLIFTYPRGGADQVDVQKWVWATGTHHVHLAASSAPLQWEAMDAAATYLASTLRIPSDGGIPPIATDRDRRDGIRDRQRLRMNGPVVPRSALRVLASAVRGGRIAREALRSVDGAALQVAGLVGPYGGLTAMGQDVCAHWARPTSAVLRIDRSDARGDTTLSAWFGPASVLIAAPLPEGEDAVTADDRVILWTVPPLRLVAVTSAWMGVAPSRAYTDANDVVIPPGTIERRLRETTTPAPPEGGSHLREAWSRHWTGYDVRTPTTCVPLVQLDDGRWWRRRNAGGGEQLVPVPAAALFDALNRLVFRSLREA